MRYLPFVLAAAVLTAPAFAESPDRADESKPICKAIKEIESRIPKRVCRTREEWEALTRQAREDLSTNGSLSRREVPPN